MTASGTGLTRWIDTVFLDIARQLRWSYLPPLMVYLAYGSSGLTAIVGSFYVKDHLGLSASFLAALGFWAGIPWTLKMPLGHLVDLLWRYKSGFVYLGAALLATSAAIMYGLIAHTAGMARTMPVEAWFVLSILLGPIGFVLQDVVADAMTVEAVPAFDARGTPFAEAEAKAMHTTMQTLGRIAIITGLIAVAALNIGMFAGVAALAEAEKDAIYARIYLYALAIPAISVAGVLLAALQRRRRARALVAQGFTQAQVTAMLDAHAEPTAPDWGILGGGLLFVVFTLTMGFADIAFNQEIIFAGSMAIVIFLMRRLIAELAPDVRGALVGTAIIIFAFRAAPGPGPGVGWWEIDVLKFDQSFLAVLSLITSALALIGMIVLRPMMARRSIADVVLLLTLAAGVLSLPNIGLYYGLHEWTARQTGGVVDARFIAILDTALESPLAQIAMVPLLAWIAQHAPARLKATFFAVLASFTNLALAASALGTKYLNEVFTVTREVRDRASGRISVPADYSELGWLLITVVLLTVALPLAAITLIQASKLRTRQ